MGRSEAEAAGVALAKEEKEQKEANKGHDGSSSLNQRVALFCVDQVQYLAGLHARYWGRLDGARREAVRLRTERRVREAFGDVGVV